MTNPNEAGRRAIDALPRKIKIAGFDFQIKRWTHHESSGVQRYGEFSSIEQVIRLQHDMPSAFKAVDTFLHELGHALYWVFGLKSEDDEERTGSTMSSGWVTVYRDNPWLAKWIG